MRLDAPDAPVYRCSSDARDWTPPFRLPLDLIHAVALGTVYATACVITRIVLDLKTWNTYPYTLSRRPFDIQRPARHDAVVWRLVPGKHSI